MRRFRVVPSSLSKFLVALAAMLSLAVGAWAAGVPADSVSLALEYAGSPVGGCDDPDEKPVGCRVVYELTVHNADEGSSLTGAWMELASATLDGADFMPDVWDYFKRFPSLPPGVDIAKEDSAKFVFELITGADYGGNLPLGDYRFVFQLVAKGLASADSGEFSRVAFDDSASVLRFKIVADTTFELDKFVLEIDADHYDPSDSTVLDESQFTSRVGAAGTPIFFSLANTGTVDLARAKVVVSSVLRDGTELMGTPGFVLGDYFTFDANVTGDSLILGGENVFVADATDSLTIQVAETAPAGVYSVSFALLGLGLYDDGSGTRFVNIGDDPVVFTVESIGLTDVPLTIAGDTDQLRRPFATTNGSWITYSVVNNKEDFDLTGAKVTISRIMRGDALVYSGVAGHGANINALFAIDPSFAGVGSTNGAALNSATEDNNNRVDPVPSSFRFRNQANVAPGTYQIFFGLTADDGVCNNTGVVDARKLEFAPITFVIDPAPVTQRVIAGLGVPQSGALYLGGGEITGQTQYTGKVVWEPELPASGRFEANETYTAVVTLTAARGYTFAGVDNTPAFTATGSTEVSHDPGTGVVRVTFPVTAGELAITARTITRQNSSTTWPVQPRRRDQVWYDAVGTVQFTVDQETIAWDPPVMEEYGVERFEAGVAYTVSMVLSPLPGFTFDGMINPFDISGAQSTSFDPATGVFSATFSATAAPMVVGTGVRSNTGDLNNYPDTHIGSGSATDASAQAGARAIRRPNDNDSLTSQYANFRFAPRAGEQPIDSVYGTQFTGKVTWTPTPGDGKFEAGVVYTASMELTPKIGYTFEGIAENTMTVGVVLSGTTVTNLTVAQEAGSNIVTVEFPAVPTPTVINTTAQATRYQIRQLVRPAVGRLPTLSVVGGTENTTTAPNGTFAGTVEWTPALTSGRFDAGVEYTASITLEAQPGWTFDGTVEGAAFAFLGLTTSPANATTGDIKHGGITHTFPEGNVVKVEFEATTSYTVTVHGSIDATAMNVPGDTSRVGLVQNVPGTVTLEVTTQGVPAGWYSTSLRNLTSSWGNADVGGSQGITTAGQIWIGNDGRGELVLEYTGDNTFNTHLASARLRLCQYEDCDTAAVEEGVRAISGAFQVNHTPFDSVISAHVGPTGTGNRPFVDGPNGAINFVNLPFNLTRYGRVVHDAVTNHRVDLKQYQSITWSLQVSDDEPWEDAETRETVGASISTDSYGNQWLTAENVGKIIGLTADVTCAVVGEGIGACADKSFDVTASIVADKINTRYDYSPTITQAANRGTASRTVSIPNVDVIFKETVSYDDDALSIVDNGYGTVTEAVVNPANNTLTFSVNELYVPGQTIVFTIPLVSDEEDNDRLDAPDALTLTVTFTAGEEENVPNVTASNILFDTEMLYGLESGRTYIVRTELSNNVFDTTVVVADGNGRISIADWISAPKANDTQGDDTDIQLILVARADEYVEWTNSPATADITIPGRRAAPTLASINVSRIDANFSALTLSVNESYSNLLNPGQGWIKVKTTMLDGVRLAVQNGIYEVRTDYVAPNPHVSPVVVGQFVSASRTVMVGVDGATEATPVVSAAHINYADEVLRNTASNGIVTGRSYMVLVDGATTGSTVVAANSSIAINDDWMGSSIRLVLLARDEAWENSAPTAAIAIPARPAAPTTVTATPVTAEGPGRIEGLTTAMQYKLATAANWTNATGTSVNITAANAGDYQVRYRATSGASAAFASVYVVVTVENQVSVAEVGREDPTGQTDEVAVFVPVSAASKFAVGPSPVVIGGVVNFFGHNGIGSLRIFDATGSVVREVKVADGWDLKDARGRYVAEGTYVVRGVLTINGERVRVSAPVTVVK